MRVVAEWEKSPNIIRSRSFEYISLMSLIAQVKYFAEEGDIYSSIILARKIEEAAKNLSARDIKGYSWPDNV